MFELLEPVFALFSWNSERKERERELNRTSVVLQRVARDLKGSVARRGLLGNARVTGRMGPAEVELIHLGEGKVDLSLEVPFKAEFSLEAAGLFRRMTSSEDPVQSGEASHEAIRLGTSILRRFQGEHLRASAGRLEIRATPGVDRGALMDLIEGATELLEELV